MARIGKYRRPIELRLLGAALYLLVPIHWGLRSRIRYLASRRFQVAPARVKLQ